MQITQEQLDSLSLAIKGEPSPQKEVAEKVEVPEKEPEQESKEEVVDTPVEDVETEVKDKVDTSVLSIGEESAAEDIDVDSLRKSIKLLQEENSRLKESPKLDPRIEKLNQIIQNGGDINQSVWELQSKDYENVDIKNPVQALSTLKDKLRYIDGLESDEVDFYVKQNYPILSGAEEEIEEGEEGKEKMKLRLEVKNNLPKLKEFQDSVRIPQVDHKAQEDARKAVDLYRTEASTRLDEIESFDVQLEPDLPVKLPFLGEGKKFVRSIVIEPENQQKFFTARYLAEDGSVNYKKFAEEMYFIANKDKIINAVYAQGKSAGKKEVVQETIGENVAHKSKRPPSPKNDNPFSGMSFARKQRN